MTEPPKKKVSIVDPSQEYAEELTKARCYISNFIDLPCQLDKSKGETVLGNLRKRLAEHERGCTVYGINQKLSYRLDKFVNIIETATATEEDNISLLISYCSCKEHSGPRFLVQIRNMVPIFFGSRGGCNVFGCNSDCLPTTGLCEKHSKTHRVTSVIKHPIQIGNQTMELIYGAPLTISAIYNRLERLAEVERELTEVKKELEKFKRQN